MSEPTSTPSARRERDEREPRHQPVRQHFARHQNGKRRRREHHLLERAVGVIRGKHSSQRQHRGEQRRHP